MKLKYLSIDLGASSGRVILTAIEDKKIKQLEIHRFKNQMLIENKRLVWDIYSIFDEILLGIKKAFKSYPEINLIGIDSFGVDFGVLDSNGKILRNPIAYRDSYHEQFISEVHDMISKEELYEISGIQYLPFNTIYQLYSLSQEKEIYSRVTKVLLIPDLIAYFLVKEMRSELTNLSTTACFDYSTETILKRIGIQKDLFPKVINPLESYGILSKEIQERININKDVSVIAVCSHDTASAVLAGYISEGVYLSSGTWSLLGTVLENPLKNKASYLNNFTNEIGFLGKTRYLKNVMGLWLINNFIKEIQEFNKNFNYLETLNTISKEQLINRYIDVDNEMFYDGKEIKNKIDLYLKKTNQLPLEKTTDYLKTIFLSMTLKYRYILEKLEINTFKTYSTITIFGGGSQVEYLNQLTADICNRTVRSGLKEATALGNAMILMIYDQVISQPEEINKYLSEAEFKEFFPIKNTEFIYKDYLKKIEGVMR